VVEMVRPGPRTQAYRAITFGLGTQEKGDGNSTPFHIPELMETKNETVLDCCKILALHSGGVKFLHPRYTRK